MNALMFINGNLPCWTFFNTNNAELQKKLNEDIENYSNLKTYCVMNTEHEYRVCCQNPFSQESILLFIDHVFTLSCNTLGEAISCAEKLALEER